MTSTQTVTTQPVTLVSYGTDHWHATPGTIAGGQAIAARLTDPVTCRRCGRQLKTVRHHGADGQPLGPVCAKRERQERATAQLKPDTVAKGREDIYDKAIVRVGRTSAGRPMFRVVSSRGDTTYLASPIACTCKAGHAGRVCHHRAAALLLTA